MLNLLNRLNSLFDPTPKELDKKMSARPRDTTFEEWVKHCLNR